MAQKGPLGIRVDLRYSYKEILLLCDGQGGFFPCWDSETEVLIEVFKNGSQFQVKFSMGDPEKMLFSYCGDRMFSGVKSYEEWFLSRGKDEEESWLLDQLAEKLRICKL